jgi:hypothetical protein
LKNNQIYLFKFSEEIVMENSTGKTTRREIPDRRKRLTPFISRYSFIGGRRKIVRREEDKKKYAFVDLYSTRLFIILLILSAFSIVDSYFTLSLIKENLAVEINPIMAFFLERGSTPFVLFKYLITTIPLFILCICKNRPTTKVLIGFTVFIYLFIIMHELNMMYHFFPISQKMSYVF